MSNMKNGVSGSTIADMLVSDYGFNREAALTIITGTLLLIEKAQVVKEYRVMYFFGAWVTKSVIPAESDKEAIFDAQDDAASLMQKGFKVALFCGNRKVMSYN